MERQIYPVLRIGDWRVSPASGEISHGGETSRLEARTMRLLVCLAERPGEVVSIEELLDKAWSGVIVSSDSVYQAVASLRRLLGDDPKQPIYIETVPRLGYRMVAAVSPWADSAAPLGSASAPTTTRAAGELAASSGPSASGLRLRTAMPWAIGAAICVALFAGFVFYRRSGRSDQAALASPVAQPQKSIAVLPFLDLTPEMKEEEFADGMTEELIDKLSKVPGFRVPAATSSFYFKYKKIPVAEIAKSLGVVYVLDGSTRKSGGSVRIAARLVRAENGYVIWSETYDRPFGDRVLIQDTIASEVTKALRASIEAAPGHDRSSQ